MQRTVAYLVGSLVLAAPLFAQPSLMGETLTSNRWDRLPSDTLQLVVFYDGHATGEAVLAVEVSKQEETRIGAKKNKATNRAWLRVGDLQKFDVQIATREYALNGWTPTGRFAVDGVQPDGVIDGIAFGMFWKDAEGRYRLAKSNDDSETFGARFVCGWPLGMSDAQFQLRTPQITDPSTRYTAKTTLCGAKLLPDGLYRLHNAEKQENESERMRKRATQLEEEDKQPRPSRVEPRARSYRRPARSRLRGSKN